MTKRETRVINAFINCVQSGEYSLDYAILLIEDNTRYGWLSEDAKEVFYEAVDPEPEPEPEPEVILTEPEPEPEPEVILTEPEDEPAEDLIEEPEEDTITSE